MGASLLETLGNLHVKRSLICHVRTDDALTPVALREELFSIGAQALNRIAVASLVQEFLIRNGIATLQVALNGKCASAMPVRRRRYKHVSTSMKRGPNDVLDVLSRMSRTRSSSQASNLSRMRSVGTLNVQNSANSSEQSLWCRICRICRLKPAANLDTTSDAMKGRNDRDVGRLTIQYGVPLAQNRVDRGQSTAVFSRFR